MPWKTHGETRRSRLHRSPSDQHDKLTRSFEQSARQHTTLEVATEIGRAISAADNEPENEGVIVISQFVWQQLSGADPAILDKSLQLSGNTYCVIGVMAGGFNYPRQTELDEGDSHIDATDVWVRLALTAKQRANRGLPGDSYASGRLKQGVSTRQTEVEIPPDST